ncbi:hypothetical protein [Streptomyces sp. Agncl-13]
MNDTLIPAVMIALAWCSQRSGSDGVSSPARAVMA